MTLAVGGMLNVITATVSGPGSPLTGSGYVVYVRIQGFSTGEGALTLSYFFWLITLVASSGSDLA